MRKSIAISLLLTGGALSSLFADSPWNHAVQISVTVDASVPSLTLHWPQDTNDHGDGYTPVYWVYRKAVNDTSWGTGTLVSPQGATSHRDDDVTTGTAYDYRVVKHYNHYGQDYWGYGYVRAGINRPLVDDRGTVLLVVDNLISGELGAELATLQSDLVGDGWKVVLIDDFNSASPAASLRSRIQAEYLRPGADVQAVFLLGHLPLVRSGQTNPDGHGARPLPADVFYADIDGDWGEPVADGQYAPGTLPSDVELAVGRVDFANMPGIAPDEIATLQAYLDKNHAYRHAALALPTQAALIGDGFGDGSRGESFSASGYRNFAPMAPVAGAAIDVRDNFHGTDSQANDWISVLSGNDYWWVYGCGAGSVTSMDGLGTHGLYSAVWSSDLVAPGARGIFYLLFGSWMVDWAQPDNIMRAALTAPAYGLTCAWSGRPYLYFFPMGSGETVGAGIRLSQNNDGSLYHTADARHLRGVHIALLGDPTLRLYPVTPPSQLTGIRNGGTVELRWGASPAASEGYHVYRAGAAGEPFVRLTESPVAGTAFTDSGAPENPTYQVRAVMLQTTASGSYYDASQGIFWSPGAGPPPGGSDWTWFDDSLPAGAQSGGSGGDDWHWVSADPAPYSGVWAHRSILADGLHEHYFTSAFRVMAVASGVKLFAYVQIEAGSAPSEIMLSWLDDGGSWEHRAYWGQNAIPFGTNDSAGRRYMGAIPEGDQSGRWVRLEVPASAVDLERKTVVGMSFSLYNGRASWDKAGVTLTNILLESP